MNQATKSEETREKILTTAMELFYLNGYDKTSMNDIANAIEKSKGAIYHHFKSKEDIMEAIFNADESGECLIKAFSDCDMTGREKLKNLFSYVTCDEENMKQVIMCSDLMKNPKYFAMLFKSSVSQTAPVIEKIIIEGNMDGSLKVSEPKFAAEILCILLNFWLNPVLEKSELEEVERKANYFKEIAEVMGVDIFDTQLLEEYKQFFNNYFNKLFERKNDND